ncbi:MAG: PstS family phosphate ABC transporter substrate-binding protein [Leptospiraceae bacterium]|nr:PstS family phosphate ABC transporter substrate-binding protein [Leptospiraceae bacterium]
MKGIARYAIAMATISSLSLIVNCGEKQLIEIDGSSTVYPITAAVAEEFRGVNSDVHVTVGISGTGGGFKKFCNGETAISDASREIKDSEREACAANGVEFIEFSVAYDGLAVVANKDNDFIDKLTVDQLKKIFEAEPLSANWSDVSADWPAEEIKVFAPGQDSGTYDYFKEAILGEEVNMRPDAQYSEDDNVLVIGVAGEKYAIGFFGLAYYEENADTLKLVPIVNPQTGAAVQPDLETVKSGTYAPLSRPLFIYVSKKALERAEVLQFVRFYMEEAAKLSKEVGYIPLEDSIYTNNQSQIDAAVN